MSASRSPDASRLVLDFGRDEVLREACCLLCGSIGTRVLRELGYTGPIITRPTGNPRQLASFATALTWLAMLRADAIGNSRHRAHV
jgi:hypothetical protein